MHIPANLLLMFMRKCDFASHLISQFAIANEPTKKNLPLKSTRSFCKKRLSYLRQNLDLDDLLQFVGIVLVLLGRGLHHRVVEPRVVVRAVAVVGRHVRVVVL